MSVFDFFEIVSSQEKFDDYNSIKKILHCDAWNDFLRYQQKFLLSFLLPFII